MPTLMQLQQRSGHSARKDGTREPTAMRGRQQGADVVAKEMPESQWEHSLFRSALVTEERKETKDTGGRPGIYAPFSH